MMVWSQDILECEVKWALWSITTNKASGDDEIPTVLFQILKDDAIKILKSILPTNLENSAVATGLKSSVFILIPKKGNAKEWSNYHTISLISHACKAMLKILQARPQQYVTVNFQLFKMDLVKAEEPEIKLPTSIGSSKKQENSRKKHLLLLYWSRQSLWPCRSQQTGNFLKRWEHRTTLPASWETCMHVKKQQLELDMEQQTGSK